MRKKKVITFSVQKGLMIMTKREESSVGVCKKLMIMGNKRNVKAA
jgi:hypothetical protein